MRTPICLPTLLFLLLGIGEAAPASQSSYEEDINRIVDQGMNHSELAVTAQYLCDRIGARLTNSPQMRNAEQWTQDRFRGWGLTNIRKEAFEFGRGWSIDEVSVRMTSPRIQVLRAIPIAWTPGTDKILTAGIVVAPISRERDFETWRGRLRDKIVLVSAPDEGSEPDTAPFLRFSEEDLSKLDEYQPPIESPATEAKRLKERRLEARMDTFLADEGALAYIRKSKRDGGLLHGEGYLYKAREPAKVPGIELAAEDYRRLARLAKTDTIPALEILSRVRFYEDDLNAYNIFAEIQGSDVNAGHVMAGAHLDSWVAADGAADNAAGTATVMEAARILRALDVKPKRTIRFALWSGEEQGLLGSFAYVERHVANRPPTTDPELRQYDRHRTWRMRWPITPGPEYSKLAGYFNVDNGSGRIRGVYAEGNFAVVPILREWLAPFASMGATKIVARNRCCTDSVYFQTVGVPAFQFIQDPLDYDSRLHHTSVDTFDHLKIQDLKQAAVILAAFLLQAANREQPLPAKPLPSKPNVTNPYEYVDDVD